jgi:hypothetical protein
VFGGERKMKDLYLHKLSDNEYAIFGEIKYTNHEYKSVIVDGEKYSKTVLVDAVMNMEQEYKKGELQKVTTNFLHSFGESEITLYYKKWMYSHTMQDLARYEWSTNEYVYFLKFIDFYKLLPPKLYEHKQRFKTYNNHEILFTGKADIYGKSPCFYFLVTGYGFNNYVMMELNYTQVVEYNIPKNKLKHNLMNYRWQSWVNKLILDTYPNEDFKKVHLITKFIEETKFLYQKKQI